jgi:hypothetical protein
MVIGRHEHEHGRPPPDLGNVGRRYQTRDAGFGRIITSAPMPLMHFQRKLSMVPRKRMPSLLQGIQGFAGQPPRRRVHAQVGALTDDVDPCAA